MRICMPFLGLLLWSLQVWGAGQPCVGVKSAQDILACAISHHPDVQISEANLRRDQALKKIAKQVPNPAIEAKVLGGHVGSDSVVDIEINLGQTIELGGKRKNRIKQAVASANLTQAELLASRELTALNTVLALYRLRQIRSELPVVHEGMATFHNIIGHFKNRPKLAPEQEVSATVFKLVADDYKLKKAGLTQEQASLQKFLELATGLPVPTIQKYLPPRKSRWPKFDAYQGGGQNAALAKAMAEKTIAEANTQLAKSSAWPDFKLGPSLATQSGIPGNNTVAGGNVSLALPFFSLNRGSIDFAKRDSYRANLAYQLTLVKNENEREWLILRYHTALKMLAQLKLNGVFQAEHRNMEFLYEHGLVSSSLVIETHRQIFEITASMNEQELTAIDALWRLYILDGKLSGAEI